MSLRIIIDKPADGGVKGHLCERCANSRHRTGSFKELWECGRFKSPVTGEVNSCSEFHSKDLKYEAPTNILRQAFIMITFYSKNYFLDKNQMDSWEDIYDDAKREAALVKWGLLKTPETPATPAE